MADTRARGVRSTGVKSAGNSRKKTAARPRAGASKSRTAAKARPAPQIKRGDPRETFGTLMAFLSVIVLILHFAGDSNGPLRGLHALAEGLFGGMSLLLPALLFALCVAAFFAAKRKSGPGWAILPVAAVFSLLTAVQGFFVKKVLASIGIRGYVNFLRQAYKMREGGGALGSLLAYPLKILTPWGTLLVLFAVWFLLLQSKGVISVSRMGSALSRGGRDAKKKLDGYVDKVRTRNEQRRIEHEKLFEEEIDSAPASSGVHLPFLGRLGKGQSRVTALQSVGDEFTVPSVDASAGRGKGKASPVRAQDKPYKGEPYTVSDRKRGILDEVDAEPLETRSERFMRSADKERERNARVKNGAAKTSDAASGQAAPSDRAAAKPLTPRNETKAKDGAPAAEAERPAHQPQQPKPSFFDETKAGASPVRQNSEQGKPTATTYVPPRQERQAQPAQPAKPAAEPAEEEHSYRYPPLELMEAGSGSFAVSRFDDSDRRKAEVLLKTLDDFHIPVELTGVSHGPAVTRFEIRPQPGIKVSKVASYEADIAMALSAESVRIEAPIPGKNAVGVEVPNDAKEMVHLRDILQSEEVRRSTKRLIVCLGKDNSGRFVVADLAKMPHVLIAGQTGSGKSVCINALVISILYRNSPDEVKLIMIDPKMVELNVYNTIPHLLVPVVIDPRKAAGALEWAVGEMDRRYNLFKEHGANNIESYNSRLSPDEKPLPHIVIVVDELADLMMTAPKDVENAINRLAQLARAAGMHLVIATQRPSVDVITGLIKANIPTRIAFTVASGVDSRTILDSVGAEKLLGNGDMLYLPPNKNKPVRVQGAWVSEEEVREVVDYISGGEQAVFDEDMLEHMESAALSDAAKRDKKEEQAAEDIDDLFEQAVRSVVEAGQASISMLQRKLRVGYARAGRLIDEMAQRGYVSASEGSKSREVLITREQLEYIFKKDE